MYKNMKIIFCLIILVGCIYSQEMAEFRISGKAEFQKSEIIANDKRDFNGDICAGLIIETDLIGLQFDSYNGIVDKNEEPGKIFLFLSAGERVINIFKSGYKPLNIILSEIGIDLNSGDVWKIKITGEKDKIPVIIRIQPETAELSIDNIRMKKSSNYLLTSGFHEVKLTLENYKSIVDTIEVSPTSLFFEYKLEELSLVGVAVNTNPVDAEVFINGIPRGRTNLTFFEFPGKKRLRIFKKDYLEINEEIKIFDTDDINKNSFTYSLDPIENRDLLSDQFNATLNFKVFPRDAEIKIQKQNYGSQRKIKLPPGKYFVEVEKEGYKKINEIIDVENLEPMTLEYNLSPITGTLLFSSKPAEAKVELFKDGSLVQSWEGLKRIQDLRIGSYEIEVSYIGFNKQRKKINIKEDEQLVTNIELIKFVGIPYLFQEKITTDSDLIANFKITRDSSKAVITYDLNGKVEEEYEVNLFLVSERDNSFSKQLDKVSGSVGEGKFYGRDNIIQWNYKVEFPSGIDDDEYYLLIKAEEAGGGFSIWYIVGAAIGGGVAAILAGGSGGDSSSGGSTTTIDPPPGRPD